MNEEIKKDKHEGIKKVPVKGYRRIHSDIDVEGIPLYFIVILIDNEYRTGWSTHLPFTSIDPTGNCGYSDMYAQVDTSEEPVAEYILY